MVHKPDPPPPVPVTDPALDVQGQVANQANIAALQTTAEQDTASLMARYGKILALSGAAGGVPLSAATLPATSLQVGR